MAPESTALDQTRSHRSVATTAQTRKRDHRFYTVMAFAMAAGIFTGFAPTYYARTYFHGPAIPLWVHIHGAVFTAWILLYLLQNLLAMYGGMKLHRSLGIVGLVLATGVVFLGSAIAFRQARQGRFFPFPDAASDLAISFCQMLLFGTFIALGLLWRRNAETHKRLMLMSSQLFFFPAFGRLMHGIGPHHPRTRPVLLLCRPHLRPDHAPHHPPRLSLGSSPSHPHDAAIYRNGIACPALALLRHMAAVDSPTSLTAN